MLSYMIPVDDKPPPSKTHLQLELEMLQKVSDEPGFQEQAVGLMLEAQQQQQHHQPAILTNGSVIIKKPARRAAPPAISTESSVSSLSSRASDGTTPTDKMRPRLQNGAAKTTLKRVSFGSSKGSMVETLIYETPLHEEPEVATPTTEVPCSFTTDGESTIDSKNPSTRVRVTFYESSRPLVVHSPEPGDPLLDALDAVMTSESPADPPQYMRQASTDSGWDNPFRPDGDLSREADEIVERIREGLPIGNGTAGSPVADVVDSKLVTSVNAPPTGSSNGTNGAAKSAAPGPVAVQRTVLAPGASEPEHVVLKKKQKCRCCVIQ